MYEKYKFRNMKNKQKSETWKSETKKVPNSLRTYSEEERNRL